MSNGNIFNQFLKGNRSLAESYWVWGVLIGNVGIKLLIALVSPSVIAVAVLALLSLFYLMFATVGIWRSAEKYDTQRGVASWGSIAKTVIIIGWLFTLLHVVTLISKT